jgi:hypothetical protein
MGKRIFKSLLLFFFVIAAASGVYIFTQQSSASNYTSENVKLPTVVAAETPSPTQVSPDGKKTLTMKTSEANGITTYSFYSGDTNMFYKDLTNDSAMSIPFNTWSVDDKYFYVRETTPNQTNYYVIPGQINITDKFTEKYPTYKLQDVTGWASPTLLIVNANTGSADISFWFDLTSQSFIRLSNRFN